MRRMIVAVVAGLLMAVVAEAGWFKTDVKPANLRCEYLENPLGIDSRAPRLSWEMGERGQPLR